MALWPCERPRDHCYDAEYRCIRCGYALPGEPLQTLALRRTVAFVTRYVGRKMSRGSKKGTRLCTFCGGRHFPNSATGRDHFNPRRKQP